jgi:hypothetical protein
MDRDGIHTTKEGRKTLPWALLEADGVFGSTDIPAACPNSVGMAEPPQIVRLSDLMPS